MTYAASGSGWVGAMVVWLLALVSVPAVTAEPDTGHAEDWHESFPIGVAELGEGHTYHVWIADGWVHAKREAGDGALTWYVVLAEVAGNEMPVIEHAEGSTYFAVSYADGRYFVRDDIKQLTSVRQRKTSDAGTLPIDRFVDDSADSRGRAGPGVESQFLRAWTAGDWFVVAGGANEDRADVFVRLDANEAAGGYGFSGHPDSRLRDVFHGETRIIDDGEFLHAERTLEVELQAKQARAELADNPAPALAGAQWLGEEDDFGLEQLRGEVVLLDFWATWCMPCIAKMPEVIELHKTYADRGLRVVGVHHERGADTAAAFVEENDIAFPVLIDDGRTVEAYTVSALPTYFLVDRAGNIAWGPSHALPSTEDIERLLAP